MTRDEALRALVRIRGFVLNHRAVGGCRVLSQGSDCLCPRCDLDRLDAVLAATPDEGQRLTMADVRIVLDAFDRGVFVRNTTHDHDPAWAIKCFREIAALARLQQASKAQP